MKKTGKSENLQLDSPIRYLFHQQRLIAQNNPVPNVSSRSNNQPNSQYIIPEALILQNHNRNPQQQHVSPSYNQYHQLNRLSKNLQIKSKSSREIKQDLFLNNLNKNFKHAIKIVESIPNLHLQEEKQESSLTNNKIIEDQLQSDHYQKKTFAVKQNLQSFFDNQRSYKHDNTYFQNINLKQLESNNTSFINFSYIYPEQEKKEKKYVESLENTGFKFAQNKSMEQKTRKKSYSTYVLDKNFTAQYYDDLNHIEQRLKEIENQKEVLREEGKNLRQTSENKSFVKRNRKSIDYNDKNLFLKSKERFRKEEKQSCNYINEKNCKSNKALQNQIRDHSYQEKKRKDYNFNGNNKITQTNKMISVKKQFQQIQKDFFFVNKMINNNEKLKQKGSVYIKKLQRKEKDSSNQIQSLQQKDSSIFINKMMQTKKQKESNSKKVGPEKKKDSFSYNKNIDLQKQRNSFSINHDGSQKNKQELSKFLDQDIQNVPKMLKQYSYSNKLFDHSNYKDISQLNKVVDLKKVDPNVFDQKIQKESSYSNKLLENPNNQKDFQYSYKVDPRKQKNSSCSNKVADQKKQKNPLYNKAAEWKKFKKFFYFNKVVDQKIYQDYKKQIKIVDNKNQNNSYSMKKNEFKKKKEFSNSKKQKDYSNLNKQKQFFNSKKQKESFFSIKKVLESQKNRQNEIQVSNNKEQKLNSNNNEYIQLFKVQSQGEIYGNRQIDNQEKKFINSLQQQIYLDSQLRMKKQSFNLTKHMNQLIRVIKQKNLNINIKNQFCSNLEQNDPLTSRTFICRPQQLIDAWIRAQASWRNKLCNKFRISTLRNILQKMRLIQNEITTQYLVSYLNIQIGTFYKKRDLILVSKRLSKGQSKITVDEFLRTFQK